MTQTSSKVRQEDRRPSEGRLPPEAKPELGSEQQKLSVFVGSWRGVGRGGGAQATVEETYEWVTGKFFLQSHFDQRFGSIPHVGVGVIGYDPQAKHYFAHMVDNIGYNRNYEVRDEGHGVWSYSGERERARLSFKGDTMNVRWEHRPNGGPWEELCEYDLTRHSADTTH